MANTTFAPAAIDEKLQLLRDAIWERRPILGEIMQKHGNKFLFDYARDFMDVNWTPTLDPYKPELIDALVEMARERLGDDEAAKLDRQLHRSALVSTADHHAFIDHPFWVNANIISALPFQEYPHPDITSLVVLSFAGVSLNNASGFPRGILFHGGAGHSGNLIRLPILPDKIKMGTVYASRAFNREDLDRAQAALEQKVTAGEVSRECADGVRRILYTEFGNADVLDSPDLNTQITKVNYSLWPQCFHPAAGEAPRGPAVLDLLYLEIETLVTRLLLKRHLSEQTLIHRTLFDRDIQTLVLKYFDSIAGAFSLEHGWGTYMFWAVDKHLHRVKLMLSSDRTMLVSETQPELNVAFTPESIAMALEQKKIYPSMLLCYLMVSLYYGMKCLGGFCQVHDLTMTKEAWGKLLRDIGETKEADALEPIQTKELGGDGMVLAYNKSEEGQLYPATGIDMILNDRDTSTHKYLERSKAVTMSEMMNPMLPEMYTVLYPSYERDMSMCDIHPEVIMEQTGLAEKLLKQNEMSRLQR